MRLARTAALEVADGLAFGACRGLGWAADHLQATSAGCLALSQRLHERWLGAGVAWEQRLDPRRRHLRLGYAAGLFADVAARRAAAQHAGQAVTAAGSVTTEENL